MVLKSVLRHTIHEVLTEHEVDDGQLADDLLDRLCLDLGEEVCDDEDEDEEPAMLGSGRDD